MQARSATMERGATRLRFLDGLRGWAAVVVLLHHVFIDGLPANALMADRSLWAKVFFLNGTLAVSVFFVISGFSLSIRYLETGNGQRLGPDRRRTLSAAGAADLRHLRHHLRVAFVGPHSAGGAAPGPARSVPGLHADHRAAVELLVVESVRRLFGRRNLRSSALDHDLRVLRLVHGVCGRGLAAAFPAPHGDVGRVVRRAGGIADLLRAVRRRHPDRRSVSARRIDHRQPGGSGTVPRRTAFDFAAEHLVRTGLCRRRHLSDGRRGILRAGTPLL